MVYILAMRLPFHSIHAHHFARATICIPFVRVADPVYNVVRTIDLARRASELKVVITLFPNSASRLST